MDERTDSASSCSPSISLVLTTSSVSAERLAWSRRAAEVAHKSLTDFVLDAACQAAEQTLLDQRLFMVSGSQYQALLEMLERPESDNAGLADLFARRAPWVDK